MAKALTVKTIENAKPGNSRREVPDGALPGLYLIVQATGARSWALRYRVGGRPRKLTLGAFPAVDLVGARERARAAMRAVAEGRDPGDEKKAARRKAAAGDDTIEAVALKFIERYAKRSTRETSWIETARILGLRPDPEDPAKLVRKDGGGDVLSRWKGRTVHDIKRADVIELLDGVVDRGSPIMANRVLAAVRKMFAWAASRDIVAASPCAGVAPPAPEIERDRVLGDDELRAVWGACDRIGWPFGPMAKLLILTAQRRDEVAEMRWTEIDFAARTWTLPRGRVKNDKAHVVHLSDAALGILRSLPRTKGSDLVFTTTGATPVTGFSRAKNRIDATILADNCRSLDRWTLHDLRRTSATGMAERLKIAPHVVDKILNHKTGTIKGVAAIYNRAEYAEERRAALEAWGRYVENLVTPAPANVVALCS
jgi:integrase